MMCRCLLLGTLLVSAGRAQPNACDPELQKLADKKDPKGYQPRPGRCEGVYDPQRRSDPPLLLASYTTMHDSFDPAKDSKVNVDWSYPGSEGVHIRCFSLLRNAQYIYQMDAVPGGSRPPFLWPLEIVRDLSLDEDKLALLGWVTYKTPRGAKELYVPLKVMAGKGATTAGRPELQILPGYDLNSVHLTVEALNADFTTAKTLVNGVELKDVSLSPTAPIVLGPKHLMIARAGFYCVTLRAEVTGGSPATLPNLSLLCAVTVSRQPLSRSRFRAVSKASRYWSG